MATCNIVGTLQGSDGLPCAGSIVVSAQSYFFDDSTTPDTIILPSTKTFTIASTGVVNITLPRSEVQRIAYDFKLTPAGGSTIAFSAVIPNLPTVELASLMSTPFTSDRAASGALRIASEMLTNANVRPYIVSGLGMPKQANPPQAPVSNDVIWINTSNGRLHTWNSVLGAWLSEPYTVTVGARGYSASAIPEAMLPGWEQSGFIYLSRIVTRYEVVANPNDSNRWTMQPVLFKTGNASPVSVGSLVASNASGYVVGTTRNIVVAPNAAYDATEIHSVGLQIVKSGFPGNLNASCTFHFRNLFFPGA